MNVNYKIFHLGSKAKGYINERLCAVEGLTLTSSIKNKIDLSKGEITTYASSNLSNNDLLNLEGSDILDKNITTSNTNKWLVKKIKSFLKLSKNNYVILELADDYPQKDVIKRFPFWNVLYRNSEPYYILDHNDSEETILEAIMQNSSYWPRGMGIFTTIKNISSYFSNRDHIKSKDFFETAAKNIQKIYVIAYDQLSYLFWEKNK